MNDELPCLFCEEGFEPGEEFREMPYYAGNGECGIRRVHLECTTRSIMGSVGHQKGECSCYGQEDHSEDGLTYREGAKAALAYFREHRVTPKRGPQCN